jgi:gas vesicle protein
VAKEKKSGSEFFWGLVFGLLVGAVIAILLAPQPGDETREQLAEQSEELRKTGQQRAEQLRAELKERYGDAIVQGRAAYERAKDEVLTRYSRAKNAE